MAIYDEAREPWLVPYETLFVPIRYGETRVIANRYPAALPVTLIHQVGMAAFVNA